MIGALVFMVRSSYRSEARAARPTTPALLLERIAGRIARATRRRRRGRAIRHADDDLHAGADRWSTHFGALPVGESGANPSDGDLTVLVEIPERCGRTGTGPRA